ncbi:MAG TPA: response regulator transcription factor [Candidatus Polarisedimenticolia bacterium]|nr:response regulator transcription factor [Candidatus Polarisedimenticolia bacterium]
MITDDHPLVRRGLRAILEAHTEWEVCGEASSGPEALGKAKELRPDVVVMDISMPGPSGLETTRLIRDALPETEVLMVTMHNSRELVSAARAAGARGYLVKSDSVSHLIEALSAVCRHEPYFPKWAGEGEMNGRRSPRKPSQDNDRD